MACLSKTTAGASAHACVWQVQPSIAHDGKNRILHVGDITDLKWEGQPYVVI